MQASMIRGGTIYAQTARFDTARAMTEDEMRMRAPSIFATTAHESRSDRFRPIPTIEILRGLQKQAGFSVVGVKQSTARDPGKAPFTKHLIRLRRLDDVKHRVGDSVLEALLRNGNDGSSAYDLMAGLFRICCLNSLVAQTSTIDSIKVRHSGDVMGKVIDGTFRVVQEADKVLAAPQDWSGVKLDTNHRVAFAKAAHVLRFADNDGNVTTPIQPTKLLEARRVEDRATDLWTTFNVVQENVIKGGLRGIGRNAAGQTRRTTTRAINGIDQDVKLNKALWVLAEELRKAAA